MTNLSTLPITLLPIPAAAAHRQVELALRPALMQHYLTAGSHDTSVTYEACHVLDAKYEPGSRCSILYQLGERMVIGELQWHETVRNPEGAPGTGAQRAPRGQGALTQMEIYPFEHDPALPGLAIALDEQRMIGILNTTLPECLAGAASVLRCRVTPLRYRLGKRCTLRFDLWLRDEARGVIRTRTLYGKLYHSANKAQAVYAEMQMLAAALDPRKDQSAVALAQAVAFAPELPMVFQSAVAGVPLDMLLSQPKRTACAYNQGVRAGIRGAAAALAALHQVEAVSGRLRPVAAELERFKSRSAHIMGVAPGVGADLSNLAQALPTWLDRLPAWGAEERLVHGDCKPSQFFVMPASQDEDGAAPLAAVALLDFDHCGMADPAADVGNFLATLRQLGIRQALRQRQSRNRVETTSSHTRQGVRPTAFQPQGAPNASAVDLQRELAALEERFLTEYLAARQCHPAFRLRATWYQAVALLRKALRSFARSPHSPLPALLVEEAWRCLKSEGMMG